MRLLKVRKMRTVASILFALFMTFAMILPAMAAEWTVSGNVESHDPTVIKEGSTWWQFYTGDYLKVKYSSDGENWNQGVPIFNGTLSWWHNYVNRSENVNEVWAPDIFYNEGRYWLYYAYSEFGTNKSLIGLMSCSSIATGDWRDDGLVIYSDSTKDYNAIDPGITKDASGNLWMSFGSFFSGIKLVKLDPATMKPESGAAIQTIATRPNVSGNPIEGAKIVYTNGYYYMFVAFDLCCKGSDSTYKIAYGRSTSITGTYFDKNGTSMLNGGGTIMEVGDSRWKGPGGQEPFWDGSKWIMVRHAYDSNNNNYPTLRIRDMYWDAEKWPSYNASSGYYKIQNRGFSSLYIDGLGATTDGANLAQWASSTSYNQQFDIINLSNRYYTLINRTTGKAIDGMGRTTAGSDAGQWSSGTSYNQQWEIIDAGGGYVKFMNRATGLYLDNGNQSGDGSIVKQYGNSTSYNLQWKLYKQ
ncbi:family 43 glycosylhydrolase [Paenibacillus sp. Soil522]|uniref:family 43 glycosylhydrolase n=1 Tax=Paenibacillus sp. Soil522 TaxID=1736388 RepID=UPI0006F1CF0D|nr:family 43 glycosylhydrolase [Paenibacillus sp. Soil522]KRE28213.1 protein AbnA [Paenibacillus sp. Soil522]